MFNERDVFLGHGSSSWTTPSSMFLCFKLKTFFFLVVYILLSPCSSSCLFSLVVHTNRENKNRYVLAFLKSLVDCGLFEHIYLNFLPVGHTHCDIDQLFSRIAVWMRGMQNLITLFNIIYPNSLHFMFVLPMLAHESYTWDELAAAIRQAYKEMTQVYVLPKMINWSESIDPYLNEASTTPGLYLFLWTARVCTLLPNECSIH